MTVEKGARPIISKLGRFHLAFCSPIETAIQRGFGLGALPARFRSWEVLCTTTSSRNAVCSRCFGMVLDNSLNRNRGR